MKHVAIQMKRPRPAATAVARYGYNSDDILKWLLAGVLAAGLLTGIPRVRADETLASVSPTTLEYVRKAAVGDRFEIESSRLAAQKSENPEIRAFAQDMIEDNAQSTDKFKDAVKLGRTSVTLPAALDPSHQQLLQKLAHESGTQFDQAYLQAQLQGHRDALDLHRAYAQSGDNGALKDFANQATPVVEAQLAKLEVLAQSSFTARMCQASHFEPLI